LKDTSRPSRSRFIDLGTQQLDGEALEFLARRFVNLGNFQIAVTLWHCGNLELLSVHIPVPGVNEALIVAEMEAG
jgi:hypothetical protein